MSGKFEQIAEREIFVREGWEWTRYLKSGRTLEADENEDRAEVHIEYATPGGDTGAYEATVETSGTVMTLFDSGLSPAGSEAIPRQPLGVGPFGSKMKGADDLEEHPSGEEEITGRRVK